MKAYVFGQDSQDQAHENFKFPEELLPRGNSLSAHIGHITSQGQFGIISQKMVYPKYEQPHRR